MQSKLISVGLTSSLICTSVLASISGDKRTILTSGEKVHPIRYQLGQSTLLYFGFKPETVICGNKNYFNIEKIKEGITVQPLANFSTNLTVISGTKRYLFFLMPSGGAKSDGLVDVRWVPSSVAKPVRIVTSQASETVREIGRKIKLTADVELRVLQEKVIDSGRKRIFELELKNSSKVTISTREIEIVAVAGANALQSQLTVWETEEVASGKSLLGRVIVSRINRKALDIAVAFRGTNTKIRVKTH